MPRSVLDAADLVLDASHVKEILAGTTADVAKYFGMSERAAGVYQAIHQEFVSTRDDDDDECCLWVFCCCCMCVAAICDDDGSFLEKRRMDKKEPGQMSMDVEAVPQVKRESFLEMLQRGITKEAIARALSGQAFAKKERYALWLVRAKFGAQDRDELQSCIAQVKSVAPDLLTKDHVNATQLEEDFKKVKTDGKAAFRLGRSLATALFMEHGAQLHSGGLGAVGLAACEKMFCDGNLRYELTESGMHQCRWTCPAGHIPHTYKELRLSQQGVVEPDPIEVPAQCESAAESAVTDADSDPATYEQSSTAKLVNRMPYKAEPAYSSEPLKILKAFSPTRLGNTMPAALRYWGDCRPAAPQVADIVAFTASDNPQIPKGSLVKVIYLEGSGLLRPTIRAGRGSTQSEVQMPILPERAVAFWRRMLFFLLNLIIR
ncbi:unnamed protein product [Effrenium voratum]|uniref:Uncharacterized protein n=1 Tax=Effrenium voratum TaxID=2562239 RepID=A0AA36MZP3_9DINO|nr:unnamed protein product [Effrenium voratum]